MNREEYNQTLGNKPNEKIEQELCGWNFCDACINLRIRKKMPIPLLKGDNNYKPYHRYINPHLKPTGFIRKNLTLIKEIQ